MQTMPLPQLRAFLEDHLNHFIMPFWKKVGLDEEGGLCTCIADDGSIISRDKYMWSQLRAIWTFSAMHNHIEPSNPTWLQMAKNIAHFAMKHGRDEKGFWVFAVKHDGSPHTGATSIYAQGFAILGFCELYRATKDRQYLDVALDAYHRVVKRLASDEPLPVAPYAVPEGMKTHGISMMFSFSFHELAKDTGDATIAKAAADYTHQVMHHFMRDEKNALVEYVSKSGEFVDCPEGRCIVPGHAIETMWFQIHQFEHLGQREKSRRAVEIIKRHVELGWDKELGGIYLGMDLDGKEPYWKFADTKLWWPQTETLYALLLSHAITGEQWCLDWYWKMHEVAFKHYPVHPHGEWVQRLDRQFKPFNKLVALPVKDPFHLPRALICSIKLLRGLEKGNLDWKNL